MVSFPELINIVGASVALIGAIGGSFVVVVRCLSWKHIAAEWKEIAEARGVKISDLESRVSALEEKITHLEEENDALRQLNLRYQKALGRNEENVLANVPR